MSESEDAHDDDVLAAEYVLHLLDDDERRAFEARLATDRELQVRVWSWEKRLSPLSDAIEVVAPSKTLRSRVLQSVGEPPARRPAQALWAWIAGGAVTAGLLLFVLFGETFGPEPNLAVAFQAELASEDRAQVMVAGVIPATHEIVIERVTGTAPEGRVHELWLIAEGADAPVSLGLLENQGITRIRVPDDIAPGVRTGTIAVSEEPPGGSPSGAPTGPIVAAAQFSDV
ncbi:anti-sigma factor [Defluviimonas aestuarii]|uniref:anti-sigma factor n=1 Tax=Albidovulum aestuarii TaxID=1130726 RepID=UPI00249B9270|nr:anti-sigma factor [Defluviimonas aestuarii]MDI3336879.1 anti-sigma factor [Defluviimonas aestuarii]